MRLLAALACLVLVACAPDKPTTSMPPVPDPSTLRKATFGAGCFWGVEHVYQQLPGVVDAVSGYAGGKSDNPTYRQICTGETGHAEVVEVTYDPARITYARLAEVFFKMHDPTTLNRQGPDVGTQYRSVIFYHDDAQRTEAERAKVAAQPRFARPIVTTIEPAPAFWRAEEYHQDYVERTGHPSCHILRE